MSEDRLVPLSAESDGAKSSRVRSTFEGARAKELRLDIGPRGVGQMLDQALEIFRRGFFRYTAVAALVYLPERIVQVLYGEHTFPTAPVVQDFDAIMHLYAQLAPSMLAGIAANSLAAVMVARMAFADLQGRRESAWTGLGLLAKRLPALILVILGGAVLNAAGLMACCVGMIFTYWRFHLALYAFALEDQPIAASFRRGWDLSRGGFLRFYGLVIVATFLAGGIGGIASAPFSSMARGVMQSNLGITGPLFDMIFVPLSALLVGVAMGFSGIMWVVYYGDQRVRNEGLDLSLKLNALESNAAGPSRENGA